MDIYKKLEELGVELPPASPPVGSFRRVAQVGNILYVSGTGSYYGDHEIKGKVGADVVMDDAVLGARYCMYNSLASLHDYLGDLNKIKRIVKLLAFVNSDSGFIAQPAVVNGASNFLREVFGEEGEHARSAIGVNVLPSDLSVEIEMIVEIK